jgi:predicted GIY-YIG superfamily endonuclease
MRRHYVYALKNADGAVFYIGRGTGGRMMQHMGRSHNDGVNSEIAAAAGAGALVTAEVLSWHETAKDAAASEQALIKSAPSGQLCNITTRPARDKAPVESSHPVLQELRAVADRIAAVDKLIAERTGERNILIAQAWKDGMKIKELAECAGLSPGRISQLMDPRPRGRPRRKQEEPKA